MKRMTAAALVVALLALAAHSLPGGSGVAQGEPVLVVDASPEGNSAADLGPTDDCYSADAGETFTIDVAVRDISNLFGWELYIFYDPKVLEVVDRDVSMFLATRPGSRLIANADPLPDDGDGRFFLGAVDASHATESGSGVLARLTLRALGPGLSLIEITQLDVNGDGTIDMGPRLLADNGVPIGDSDGDGYFDGPVASARIAVGQSCGGPPLSSPTPTLTAGPSPTPQPTASPSPTIEGEGTPTSNETPAQGNADEGPETTPTTAGKAQPPSGPAGEGEPPSSAATPSSAADVSAWLVAVIVIGLLALGLGSYLGVRAWRRR